MVTQVDRLVRVTWKYDLKVGGVAEDISEHSVYYRAGSIPSDPAVLNAVLNDMANAALASQAAHFGHSYATNAVAAQSCRVALEDTSGHTLFEKIVAAADALAWAGAAPGPQLPWECAFVISLYGYTPGEFDPAGRYKRGRFYLPPPTSARLDSSGGGLIADADAAAIATQWGTILQELQEHDYSGFPAFAPVLGINSRRSVTFTPVTHLRFDTKVDRQVRRQNQEHASIASAPYPAP